MVTKGISDRIILGKRDQVLQTHIFIKMLQYNIRPLEKDIFIIVELYRFGGYNNSEEQAKFIDTCLKKGYRKSEQSLRNAISKYIRNGMFEKRRNSTLKVSENFLPKIECDKLILEYIISHAE